MTYTLKLDLDDYQHSALKTLLRTTLERAERDRIADSPFPQAIQAIQEQVIGYEQARAAVASLTRRFSLTEDQLVKLEAVLGDAYAYRAGEGDPGDPEDPDIWDADRVGMANAQELAGMFGLAIS
jgi:hypothetical protein